VHHQSAKLPELEIEKFDGDPMKWREFWDSFSSTVHKNPAIPAIDKFKYLKSFLVGEVQILASGYELTAANYEGVVEALKERYGDTQAAIFAHVMAMLGLPGAEDDVAQLQRVYDELDRHIRSLVALDVPEATFGVVFTPMIFAKLPESVQVELHRKQGPKPWTLDSLRSILKEEIRARSKSQASYEKSCSESQCGSISGHPANTLPATTAGSVSCAFCAAAHFSDECSVYVTYSERIRRLNGRCGNCLSRKHATESCRLKKKCWHCGDLGHHRSLCMVNLNVADDFHATQQNVHGEAPNPMADDFLSRNVNVNQVVSHDKDVYLQTALANVSSGGDGQPQKARLLFDNAGSRSFITCAKARQLGLKIIDEDKISVAGFEDNQRRTRLYKVVEFDVIDNDGERVKITANVTENITADIVRAPIDVKKYPFVRSLRMAEPEYGRLQTLPVDILIAGDYYYDFITEGTIRADGGMVLVPSRLGYLTAGVADRVLRSRQGSLMVFSHHRQSQDPRRDSNATATNAARGRVFRPARCPAMCTTPSSDEQSLRRKDAKVLPCWRRKAGYVGV
jgi:hypothetical protein